MGRGPAGRDRSMPGGSKWVVHHLKGVYESDGFRVVAAIMAARGA